jgi:hypothetical protein
MRPMVIEWSLHDPKSCPDDDLTFSWPLLPLNAQWLPENATGWLVQ